MYTEERMVIDYLEQLDGVIRSGDQKKIASLKGQIIDRVVTLVKQRNACAEGVAQLTSVIHQNTTKKLVKIIR